MSDFSKKDILHTTCSHCGSTFEITDHQLDQAEGKVRCSQCNAIFNAYTSIEIAHPQNEQLSEPTKHQENVSLSEAMNEGLDHPKSSLNLKSSAWAMGIIALIILAAAQWVYLDRFKLVQDIRFQGSILTLCNLLSCDKSQLSNLKQIHLIERNIFSHPTEKNALLITGSFINEAPFEQVLPMLKVSLFDLQGSIIAQRVFKPIQYLSKQRQAEHIASGETIYFKIEVSDPQSIAITYEFEFL